MTGEILMKQQITGLLTIHTSNSHTIEEKKLSFRSYEFKTSVGSLGDVVILSRKQFVIYVDFKKL